MQKQALYNLKGVWLLMRSIAVVSSSVATIVSTVLPLYLYFTFSTNQLMTLFLLLIFGAFLIHGILTHILNDYVDDLSGTDTYSPAILSGGSRVIQSGFISPANLWRFGKGLLLLLGITIIVLFISGYAKLGILLSVGVWGAVSYSLPPLQFSYRPFLGEWLSTFPSVLFLGLAGAWLTLDSLPEWVMQNAVINALFCIAWVMVHHIPDREADKKATPMKQTSVVWAADRFGIAYARIPALMYFTFTALCAFWLGADRGMAALGVVAMAGASIYLIFKMDMRDYEQISAYEKIILILAMINAVWLGIFI